MAEQHDGPIRLLVTDVIMPQMSGPELASSLRKVRPSIEVLYMSGYTDDKVRDLAESDRTQVNAQALLSRRFGKENRRDSCTSGQKSKARPGREETIGGGMMRNSG